MAKQKQLFLAHENGDLIATIRTVDEIIKVKTPEYPRFIQETKNILFPFRKCKIEACNGYKISTNKNEPVESKEIKEEIFTKICSDLEIEIPITVLEEG